MTEEIKEHFLRFRVFVFFFYCVDVEEVCLCYCSPWN